MMKTLALVIALTAGFSTAHAADKFRVTAEASAGAALYKMKGKASGSYKWVDRASLPSHGAARIAALKQAMEDEITGSGHFKNDADTPAMEIVTHSAILTQVAEAGYSGQNGGAARYAVKLADLKAGGVLDATLLLPVSGHVGLADAQNYAQTNQYRVSVNGGAWMNYKTGGKYVTEVGTQLKLKAGANSIRFEPYAGGFGGYSDGREIIIEAK